MKLSLERVIEKGLPPSDCLRDFLKKDASLSPEAVCEILDELDASREVDTDDGIRLLYTALEHFVDLFGSDPLMSGRTKLLLVRIEALEEREADELERELVARFRVRPGELSELYDWGRSLLDE